MPESSPAAGVDRLASRLAGLDPALTPLVQALARLAERRDRERLRDLENKDLAPWEWRSTPAIRRTYRTSDQRRISSARYERSLQHGDGARPPHSRTVASPGPRSRTGLACRPCSSTRSAARLTSYSPKPWTAYRATRKAPPISTSDWVSTVWAWRRCRRAGSRSFTSGSAERWTSCSLLNWRGRRVEVSSRGWKPATPVAAAATATILPARGSLSSTRRRLPSSDAFSAATQQERRPRPWRTCSTRRASPALAAEPGRQARSLATDGRKTAYSARSSTSVFGSSTVAVTANTRIRDDAARCSTPSQSGFASQSRNFGSSTITSGARSGRGRRRSPVYPRLTPGSQSGCYRVCFAADGADHRWRWMAPSTPAAAIGSAGSASTARSSQRRRSSAAWSKGCVLSFLRPQPSLKLCGRIGKHRKPNGAPCSRAALRWSASWRKSTAACHGPRRCAWMVWLRSTSWRRSAPTSKPVRSRSKTGSPTPRRRARSPYIPARPKRIDS